MGKLITHQANGLEISLFPWEDAAAYVADIEAMLEETYAKPWLLDEDIDLMTPDMDAIVDDPMYDRYLAENEVKATRFWSGSSTSSPTAMCNWSFLDGDTEPELTGGLVDEPGYYESTQPYLF